MAIERSCAAIALADDLFADSFGEDAIELSGGRQSFVLGDSFLFGTGVVNGFGRAAFYLQPHASFDNSAILNLNFSLVRAKLFNLENRVDQDLMEGFDRPKIQFFGLDIALFEAAEEEPRPKAAGEKQAPTWTAGDPTHPAIVLAKIDQAEAGGLPWSTSIDISQRLLI